MCVRILYLDLPKLSYFSDRYHIREYPPLKMEIRESVEIGLVMLNCNPMEGRRREDKGCPENRIFSLVWII
jgi:hypothetical protein